MLRSSPIHPCPECGKPQRAVAYRVPWGRREPEGPEYVCPSCGGAVYPVYSWCATFWLTVGLLPLAASVLLDLPGVDSVGSVGFLLAILFVQSLLKYRLINRFESKPSKFQLPLDGTLVVFLLAGAIVGCFTLNSTKPLFCWLLGIGLFGSWMQYRRERSRRSSN